MHRHLSAGRLSLARAVEFVVAKMKSDPNAVFAGSVPYLKLAGIVLSGWQMARALLVAQAKRADDASFLRREDRDRAVLRGARAVAGAGARGVDRQRERASEGVLALSEDQF